MSSTRISSRVFLEWLDSFLSVRSCFDCLLGEFPHEKSANPLCPMWKRGPNPRASDPSHML